MSNKYSIINSNLIMASFNLYNIKSDDKIIIQDTISFKSIIDNIIIAYVSRYISCSDAEKSLVNVTYEIKLKSEDGDLDSVAEDIKSGINIFSNVFSRISLTISELTNASLLGAVITPPMYDKNTINIVNDCK